MFVVTVVVGIVTIYSPCKVDSFVFLRDTIFHLTSILLFTFCAFTKHITIYFAGSFFMLYAIYVTIVIYSWWKSKDNDDAEPGSLGATGVQAAYWHASARQKSQSTGPSRIAPSNSDHKDFNYTFLILGEPKFSGRDGIPDYEEEDDDSGEGEVTINLSGGLITPHFDHELLEDYFNPSMRTTQVSEPVEEKSSKSAMIPFDVEQPPQKSTSKTSLPSIFSNSKADLHAPLISTSSGTKKRKSNTVLSQWYWQQVQLRRRMHNHILNAEWWEYPFYLKVFAIFEFPLIFLRDITIPTVDSELWFKPYAVIQPLFSPLVIIFSMGNWHSSVGPLSTPLFGFLMGLPIAFYVFLTTHYSKPPATGIYSIIWVLMAFTMCVVWIYIFAGELVALLQTIGLISGIPPAVLGLTILAWGNSVGDLFANMAVAKQGLGEMAIAGCYGGPVFNICLGYGISFTYATLSALPQSFLLQIDTSAIISLVFLYIALISTISFTIWNKFEVTTVLGYYLLGLYCLYSVAQLCHVLLF